MTSCNQCPVVLKVHVECDALATVATLLVSSSAVTEGVDAYLPELGAPTPHIMM